MNTELHVTYHAFGVIDNKAEWPLDLPAPPNGLIHPFPGGAFVYTGIHSGLVNVQIVTFTEAPPPDTSNNWESIAEVAVVTKRGKLRLRSYDTDPEGPALTPAGRGTYRIRAYATGRDTDIDGTTPLTETYRLEVWPATDTESLVLRADDQYGAQVLQSMSHDDAPASRLPGGFVDGEAMNEPVF
ncbi:hypothetical protein [Paractinoplanes brasiliensis]|uniref:Uncharacterized protein n=1 Tax=Paractinoplanes brasiliensis TaxID=52695 RepID=A0A4V3C7B0_9ACTN|nr:hypothetical protein [Actinoplanes brasiliensis]TDO36968.1 hypothetical protein C8E87_0559 [Actinoplanes brasiliensis]GID30490.1 hypothetical protein Abr02nite_54730 [Actinoplanes brasiliensis]